MGTRITDSLSLEDGRNKGYGNNNDSINSATAGVDPASSEEVVDPRRMNAGALFVLESKGSWLHCGYHLTTSIVSPTFLALPFAFTKLGWAAAVILLTMGALFSFYSYTLISLVLEDHAKQGRRQLRFRDMAHDILGPGWARFYVGPLQFLVCFATVVGMCLLAGQSMKAIYLLSKPAGTMKLYEFIIIFGAFLLLLAQIPSFHSFRYLSLLSLLLCLAYSACVTGSSIHAGQSSLNPPKDYSLVGTKADKVFGVFSAIAIMAASYGNGIIPEIQATAAPPVTGKMFKGLLLCYAVVISTFFSVAASGYWAFGNQVQQNVIQSYFTIIILDDGSPAPGYLVPKWLIIMTNVFILLQIIGVAGVYLQPTNEFFEGLFGDPTKKVYSLRNLIPRIVSRSLAIAVATTLAAMLPFFGDLLALIGAFCLLPLDFVVPAIFYNITFKPSNKSLLFWLNTLVAVVFSLLTIIGCVASVRQIVKDANTYKLFANV